MKCEQNTEDKIQYAADKKMEFRQDEHLKAKNSISWAEGITNEIMLLCPIKPMSDVFADTL